MKQAVVKAAECESISMRADELAGSHLREGAACLLCNGALEKSVDNLIDTRFGIEGTYQAWRCLDCGLEQISPVPTAEELGHLYESVLRLWRRTKHLLHPPPRKVLLFLALPHVDLSRRRYFFSWTQRRRTLARRRLQRRPRPSNLCPQWFSGGGPRVEPKRRFRSARIGLHSPRGRYDRLHRTCTLRCDCALECFGTRARSQEGPGQSSWKLEAGRPALDQLPEQPQLAPQSLRPFLDQLARAISHFALFCADSTAFIDRCWIPGRGNTSNHSRALDHTVMYCLAVRKRRQEKHAATEPILDPDANGLCQIRLVPSTMAWQSTPARRLSSGHRNEGITRAHSYPRNQFLSRNCGSRKIYGRNGPLARCRRPRSPRRHSAAILPSMACHARIPRMALRLAAASLAARKVKGLPMPNLGAEESRWTKTIVSPR